MPRAPLPPQSSTAVPAAPDALQLRWLGTAGFHLRWGDTEALLDPYLSRPAGAVFSAPCSLAELSGASLLLISHGHFDHAFDAAAIARASGCDTYAPRAVCRRLTRSGVPEARLHPNETHRTVTHAGAHITISPSRHIRFDPALVVRTVREVWRGGIFRTMLPLLIQFPSGSSSDFLFELGAHRLLFSGSGGGRVDELARLRPTDYLLPFAGRSDVCRYYLRALRAIRPRQVVLHHFERFYPSFAMEYPVAEFCALLKRELPEVRVVVPEPGQWFTLDAPPPADDPLACPRARGTL